MSAQINFGDGTVLSVRDSAPAWVVTAEDWNCRTADGGSTFTGHVGQVVDERPDDRETSDQYIKDFGVAAMPRIGGRPTLAYGSRAASGHAARVHRLTFTWPTRVLKVTLGTGSPLVGSFDLIADGHVTATGSCRYRNEAFKPPA